ncbi:MAG: hypothetical protein O7C75_10385, partial [Verrucomicrobia bacterium]|nr:hypothetical protein [Verrucomicrobiota bacterium]
RDSRFDPLEKKRTAHSPTPLNRVPFRTDPIPFSGKAAYSRCADQSRVCSVDVKALVTKISAEKTTMFGVALPFKLPNPRTIHVVKVTRSLFMGIYRE